MKPKWLPGSCLPRLRSPPLWETRGGSIGWFRYKAEDQVTDTMRIPSSLKCYGDISYPSQTQFRTLVPGWQVDWKTPKISPLLKTILYRVTSHCYRLTVPFCALRSFPRQGVWLRGYWGVRLPSSNARDRLKNFCRKFQCSSCCIQIVPDTGECPNIHFSRNP